MFHCLTLFRSGSIESLARSIEKQLQQSSGFKVTPRDLLKAWGVTRSAEADSEGIKDILERIKEGTLGKSTIFLTFLTPLL